MYNKKSKASAVLAVVTAVLLIGFMILLPFLQYKSKGSGDFSGIFMLFTVIYAYPAIYAGAIPFTLVALIFGIKMLKQQSRKKLISYNVRMLIVTCILLPVLVFGLMLGSGIIFHSTLGFVATAYTILVSLAYIAGLIAQITAIVLLAKSPKEDIPPVIE